MFPESEGDWAWTLRQEDSGDVMAPGAMPSWILFLLWHPYTFLSHPSWKFHCRNMRARSGEAAGEAGRTSISGFLDTAVILVYLGASWKCINGLVTSSADLEERFIPRAGLFPHLSSCFFCAVTSWVGGESWGETREAQ